MRIAVNTRLLLKDRLEGIGWFTYETFSRIVRAHPEHEFFFLFDRKFDEQFVFSDNVTPEVAGPQARHPVLFYLWFEHTLPRILNKIGADLFVSPDAFASLRTKCKTLMVIHDLNFEHYPQHLPWLVRKYYRYYTPRFAGKVNRIATVSEYSKRDISTQYGISPEKIDVVYNGASPLFQPVSEETRNKVKAKYTGGANYFVFISAISPRKNLDNQLKAFDRFKSGDTRNTKLLVVGEEMWGANTLQKTFEQLRFRDDVIFAGRLGQEELARVIASALALTYVSFFEGFGIPIIEAFNAGTPVITSNVTSMPEVAGDAALIVDPHQVEGIAAAMKTLAEDPEKREELIRKGTARGREFSWDRTADKLWQSIEKTYESNQ